MTAMRMSSCRNGEAVEDRRSDGRSPRNLTERSNTWFLFTNILACSFPPIHIQIKPGSTHGSTPPPYPREHSHRLIVRHHRGTADRVKEGQGGQCLEQAQKRERMARPWSGGTCAQQPWCTHSYAARYILCGGCQLRDQMPLRDKGAGEAQRQAVRRGGERRAWRGQGMQKSDINGAGEDTWRRMLRK